MRKTNTNRHHTQTISRRKGDEVQQHIQKPHDLKLFFAKALSPFACPACSHIQTKHTVPRRVCVSRSGSLRTVHLNVFVSCLPQRRATNCACQRANEKRGVSLCVLEGLSGVISMCMCRCSPDPYVQPPSPLVHPIPPSPRACSQGPTPPPQRSNCQMRC